MLLWVKPSKQNNYDQDSAAWKVTSIEEAIDFLKKYFPFDWIEMVCHITDENNNVIVSKNKFKRMLNAL